MPKPKQGAYKQVETRLNDLLLDRDFMAEVEHLRLYDDQDIRLAGLLSLMRNYRIPSAGRLVVWNLISTGKFDLSLTLLNVELVSEVEQTVEPSIDPKLRKRLYDEDPTPHVYLALSQEATLGDIRDFVSEHGDLILSKLKGRRRVRPELLKKRNDRYLNMRDSGKNIKEIADLEGVDPSTARQIIGRQQKRKPKRDT